MARQARGFSQQQLAGMAGVSRQAVSAVESGHSDPSLRVALALAQALGMSVEELFGPGEPTAPVTAVSVAPLGRGSERPDGAPGGVRVMLAPVGDRFVALPLRGDTGVGLGFLPAGGLAAAAAPPRPGRAAPAGVGAAAFEEIAVRPIGPPRPTVVVAGCDPALPLLATPLSLLDPPVAFAWWPCGSGEALRLARAGLVHAAGVHTQAGEATPACPDGAEVVGFTAWREGLAVRPDLRSGRHRPRRDREDAGSGWSTASRGRRPAACSTASARGSTSSPPTSSATRPRRPATCRSRRPSRRAWPTRAWPASRPPAPTAWPSFRSPSERFNLVIPAEHVASREAQALLKVLASPWLLAQLAGIPGYDAATCGERFT